MVRDLIPRNLPLWFSIAVALVAGGINALFGTVVHLLQLPLYLDSIFTVIVTLHLGLIPGAITAVVTNTILAATDQVLFPLVCCNLLTALVTWIFVRQNWTTSTGGYVWLGIVLAFVNGIVGSLITYLIFSGVTAVHGIDRLVMGLVVTGQSVLTAVFWAGMITNLLDKLLSALIAFVTRDRIEKLIERSCERCRPENRRSPTPPY